MKLIKLILISGKARHGKDTTASIMYDELTKKGNKVLITHFGDLVKYICETFFEWDGKKDDKGRTLLQRIGTDEIRGQQVDYWVDFVESILDMFPAEWDYVIISDCRFPNEIDKFKQDGFDCYTVRVQRTDFESELTDKQKLHESETALDNYDFDFVLQVKSGVENVIEPVKVILECIG